LIAAIAADLLPDPAVEVADEPLLPPEPPKEPKSVVAAAPPVADEPDFDAVLVAMVDELTRSGF